MMYTLEMDGIYLEYDLRKILTNVYVKCQTGQIIGLLGRNASGKSSLMKIVFGSLEGHYRSVRINGEPQLVPFTKRISYLPQEPLLPSFVSIHKALKLFKIDPQKIVDVFPFTNDVLNLKPSQISGGTMRILEVIMILNAPSQFALLDEPFTGLMPIHVDTLKEYLSEKKKEKVIVITDHLYRHVLELSDALYVLANGKTYITNDEDRLVSLGYVREL